MKTTITNWGNYPVIEAEISTPSTVEKIQQTLFSSQELIVRGLGRSYGDSSLNTNIVSTQKLNRILKFTSTGMLTCEAGVSLHEILQTFVSRGWFLPVTPGTKFVTVGGAIAADVHGKNHHIAGSFSNHLHSFDLMLSDGTIVTCTKENNAELFWATCGGMGLTGIILQATFQLIPIQSSYIKRETLKAKNLDEIMEIFESSLDWTYSVAWIDCLKEGNSSGRSIMMRGEHALQDEIKSMKNILLIPEKSTPSVPLFLPEFTLSSFAIKSFNFLYYTKARSEISFIDYETFFYPLDRILHWNRMYGKRGFTQYQFVLPKESSKEGLKKILQKISQSGQGSFLAVLKLFGKQENYLSFPREGYTLALDFPITKNLFPLLNELDAMVADYDGRLYLAKDVRMSEQMFKRGYKNSEKFIALKYQSDKERKFHSLQSKRIGI